MPNYEHALLPTQPQDRKHFKPESHHYCFPATPQPCVLCCTSTLNLFRQV